MHYLFDLIVACYYLQSVNLLPFLFGNLYESSFGEDQGITYKTGEEEEQTEQEGDKHTEQAAL